MDEEYEIFPHKVLEDLKEDIESLKKKLSEPESATQELIAEMEDLKTTIKELNTVFKEALQDIKEEDSAKLLAILQNKVTSVVTQNETIARGMIAISDKLDDFMRKSSTTVPASSVIQSAARPSTNSVVAPLAFSNEAGNVPPAFSRSNVRSPMPGLSPSSSNVPPPPPNLKSP